MAIFDKLFTCLVYLSFEQCCISWHLSANWQIACIRKIKVTWLSMAFFRNTQEFIWKYQTNSWNAVNRSCSVASPRCLSDSGNRQLESYSSNPKLERNQTQKLSISLRRLNTQGVLSPFSRKPPKPCLKYSTSPHIILCGILIMYL